MSTTQTRAKSTLSITDLQVHLTTPDGEVTPVGPVSLNVKPGSIVGLVGESGSGKSLTANAVMGLLPRRLSSLSGSILLNGEELVGLGEDELNKVRGRDVSMIFQEPMLALNPVIKVGDHISEVLRVRRDFSRSDAKDHALKLMEKVGIRDAAERYGDYPHMFSGGMRQRIIIAMALASEPSLLIADEPTTALDVTVQAEILELLRELQAEFSMSVLYITHDLDVVMELCSEVIVMYAGQIVEHGPVADVITDPKHPYTWSLLESGHSATRGELVQIAPGSPPHPAAFPSGCRFHDRCPVVERPTCVEGTISLVQVGTSEARCMKAGNFL